MSTIRMGVIGCGTIAQVMHLRHMIDHPEKFEVVAIADAYQPVLEAVGERYNIADRYTDWHALLQRDDIDAVGIFHTGSHHDTLIAALDANKHIFCEKPMTYNLREAEAVAKRAEQSDRIVQLAYHKLYDPGFAYAKEQVELMRDLEFVRITMLHPANHLGLSPHRILRGNGVIEEGHVTPNDVQTEIEIALKAFAGGDLAVLVDEALGTRKDDQRLRLGYGWITVSIIHQIYMMYGFLGKPERVLHCDISRRGMSIHALIEYPAGLRCSMEWHYLSHLKDYLEEYAFWGNYDRVYMRLPSPYFHSFPSPVIVQSGDGDLSWKKEVIVSHDEAFKRELLAFHNNVTENKPPLTPVSLGLEHARFIQQMIDAAQ